MSMNVQCANCEERVDFTVLFEHLATAHGIRPRGVDHDLHQPAAVEVRFNVEPTDVYAWAPPLRMPVVALERALQQAQRLVITDPQAAESVIGVLAGQLPAPHLTLDQHVDAGQFGLQMGQAQIVCFGHSYTNCHTGSATKV